MLSIVPLLIKRSDNCSLVKAAIISTQMPGGQKYKVSLTVSEKEMPRDIKAACDHLLIPFDI